MPNTDKYLTASQKRLEWADGIFFGTLKGNVCYINGSKNAQFKVERAVSNAPQNVEVVILNHVAHVFTADDGDDTEETVSDSQKIAFWMCVAFIVVAGYHIFG